ncbi:MAG: RNA polymerase sigma factor [Blastocatellia bacterium]
MPKTDSNVPEKKDLEKLYEDMLPHIPTVVGQVCASLRYSPGEMELEAIAQRLRFSLWEKGYRRLRSFKPGSPPQPWLFKVALRDIRRWLQKQNRMVSLEELLPDSFSTQPDQESELLRKERWKILLAAVARLPEGQQRLFYLMRDGLSDPEIARRLRIKVTSLRVKRSRLLHKLEEMVDEDTGRGLTRMEKND